MRGTQDGQDPLPTFWDVNASHHRHEVTVSVTDDPCANEAPPTSNDFSDLVAAAVSRRSLLVGGMATAIGAFLFGSRGSVLGSVPAAAQHPTASPLLGFTPVGISTPDAVVVPPEYGLQVLYRWGDPVRGEGPTARTLLMSRPSRPSRPSRAGMRHDGLLLPAASQGQAQ